MVLKFRFLLSLFVLHSLASAQTGIDVQHYRFEIQLSDNTDAITGKASITVRFTEDASQVHFDLSSFDTKNGMVVFNVNENNETFKTTHNNDLLSIYLNRPVKTGEVHTYEIEYMGTPDDGLIISKNKFGDRTFFSDNWPNRAHNWIPCHDVPWDKASVEFIVTAPIQYKVMGNGLKVSEQITGDAKRTHWKEDIPIPTKIMVIGAADFAVKTYTSDPIPVSAWVYPRDSAAGFFDYAIAPEIVQFFSSYIAPFPFEKLANVQSTTVFGGMENASAIFYAEESVTGKRTSEPTVVHEIAHQWFGDMASEKTFAHLWLSEGFATYLTDIYFEQKYGKDQMLNRLAKERTAVIEFIKNKNQPVIDSTGDLMSLLNANSYQKGSWVLHMLRNEVGDSVFRKILQGYYHRYKGSNADTRDFQAVAEAVSGKDLSRFFNQWLFMPGIPQLRFEWKEDGNEIKGKLIQVADHLYAFPLEIAISTADGKVTMQRLTVNAKQTEFKIDLPAKPVKIELDPNVSLLFEQVK